jgi:uncharacterized protein YkwD
MCLKTNNISIHERGHRQRIRWSVRLATGISFLSVFTFVATGVGPVPAAANSSTVGVSFDMMEQGVHYLTVQERHANGCGGNLRFDDALYTAALYHSREMARSHYFSHESADHTQPSQRILWSGYNPANGWGENIAWGYPAAQTVVQAWMDSPSHRENMLNCQFHALGVGVAQAWDGTYYWTQEFGGK